MEEEEEGEGKGKTTTEVDREMNAIFSEFLAGVVKFEQQAELGRRFLLSFQQALLLLRRPSIHQKSELVQTILEQNETKRVKLYVESGCINANDSSQGVAQMNTALSRLQDHLTDADSILTELAVLMDKACSLLQNDTSDQNIDAGMGVFENVGACGWGSFMAVIYDMVKRDYLMQERVVSSLGFKSLSEELDSYSLMWSLRPFVNDDVIHDAINSRK